MFYKQCENGWITICVINSYNNIVFFKEAQKNTLLQLKHDSIEAEDSFSWFIAQICARGSKQCSWVRWHVIQDLWRVPTQYNLNKVISRCSYAYIYAYTGTIYIYIYINTYLYYIYKYIQYTTLILYDAYIYIYICIYRLYMHKLYYI